MGTNKRPFCCEFLLSSAKSTFSRASLPNEPTGLWLATTVFQAIDVTGVWRGRGRLGEEREGSFGLTDGLKLGKYRNLIWKE